MSGDRDPSSKQLMALLRAIDDQELTALQMQYVLMSGAVTVICKAAKRGTLTRDKVFALEMLFDLHEHKSEAAACKIN